FSGDVLPGGWLLEPTDYGVPTTVFGRGFELFRPERVRASFRVLALVGPQFYRLRLLTREATLGIQRNPSERLGRGSTSSQAFPAQRHLPVALLCGAKEGPRYSFANLGLYWIHGPKRISSNVWKTKTPRKSCSPQRHLLAWRLCGTKNWPRHSFAERLGHRS